MKFSWDWLSTNIPNIFKSMWKGLVDLLTIIINGIFDALDTVVSSLPSGTQILDYTLPDNYGWVLNGLNYFFDVTAMGVTLGLVIAAHVLLAVAVAVLRFFQIMQ